MSVVHQGILVGILNKGVYWGHKRIQLIFHLENLVVASLKRNESQRYNRYGLKYYLLSKTSIELIASSPCIESRTAKLSVSSSSIAPKTV